MWKLANQSHMIEFGATQKHIKAERIKLKSNVVRPPWGRKTGPTLSQVNHPTQILYEDLVHDRFSRFFRSSHCLACMEWAFPAALQQNEVWCDPQRLTVLMSTKLLQVTYRNFKAVRRWSRTMDILELTKTWWEQVKNRKVFIENYQALLVHFESRIPALPAVPCRRRPLS